MSPQDRAVAAEQIASRVIADAIAKVGETPEYLRIVALVSMQLSLFEAARAARSWEQAKGKN